MIIMLVISRIFLFVASKGCSKFRMRGSSCYKYNHERHGNQSQYITSWTLRWGVRNLTYTKFIGLFVFSVILNKASNLSKILLGTQLQVVILQKQFIR